MIDPLWELLIIGGRNSQFIFISLNLLFSIRAFFSLTSVIYFNRSIFPDDNGKYQYETVTSAAATVVITITTTTTVTEKI